MSRVKTVLIPLFSSFFLAMSFAATADCYDFGLDVPLHTRQQSFWSWAAATQSVLEYYGVNRLQCDIVDEVRFRNDCCGPNGSDLLKCNRPGEPVDIIVPLAGENVYSYPYGANSGILPWADSVASINAGKPFIMRFDYYNEDIALIYTSYDVARGYDLAGNYLVYLDPTYGYMKDAYWWLTDFPLVYEMGVYASLDWGATIVLTSNPAPDCETLVAESVTSSSATLKGSANANMRQTTANFQYSTTNFNPYSYITETGPLSVSGKDDTLLWSTLSGLSSGTTYYYRVKAVSDGGTCLSDPRSFTTTGSAGACGSANGQTLDYAPYLNLCSAGNASTVSGSGPWYWTCGGTASCSAGVHYNFGVLILSGSGTVTPNTGSITWEYGLIGTSGYYNYGTQVTLTAIPASSYVFTGWGMEGLPSACYGMGTCSMIMNKTQTIYVSFTPVKTLTVSKLGTGKGTITSTSPASPIINCGSTCSSSFVQNTPVTLTATPNPGNIFIGWSGACSGKGLCNVTMSSDQTVNANFVPDITSILMMLLND